MTGERDIQTLLARLASVPRMLDGAPEAIALLKAMTDRPGTIASDD